MWVNINGLICFPNCPQCPAGIEKGKYSLLHADYMFFALGIHSTQSTLTLFCVNVESGGGTFLSAMFGDVFMGVCAHWIFTGVHGHLFL